MVKKMIPRILLLYYVFVFLFINCHGNNDLVPGSVLLPQTNDRSILINNNKQQCDSDKYFDCSNCQSRIVCDRNHQIIRLIECTGKTPYCNQGTCVTTRPNQCDLQISSLCPGPGFFPSPISCHQYGYCTIQGSWIEHICPGLLVFEPISGLCKRRTSIGDCPTINCRLNRYRFIPYPLKKQLYFYCDSNSIMLMSCKEHEEFNPTTINCEFACSVEGRFENTADETLYYLCVKAGTTLVKYNQACDPGFVFDAVAGACAVKQSLQL